MLCYVVYVNYAEGSWHNALALRTQLTCMCLILNYRISVISVTQF